jgi:hypothetical protein
MDGCNPPRAKGLDRWVAPTLLPSIPSSWIRLRVGSGRPSDRPCGPFGTDSKLFALRFADGTRSARAAAPHSGSRESPCISRDGLTTTLHPIKNYTYLPPSGIRAAMANRTFLNHGIRVVAALALLVAIMSSPIRPLRRAADSHPDHLRRNVGIPKGGSTHHRSSAPVHARVVKVKALHSENERERDGASCRASLSFGPFPTPSPHVGCHPTHSHLHLSMSPLRC